MKNLAIEIKKGQLVEVPVEYQEEEGCVAFQLVELSYSFYGNIMTSTHDTKILKNGKQIIHGGNGFIQNGIEI